MKQKLNFVPRHGAAKSVVQCFRNRLKSRSEGTSPEDKCNNKLLTLLGTPGSGKSTFLAEFPKSTQYEHYAEGRAKDEGLDLPPLVALLTFNSGGMDNPNVPAIGLRIIYGALRMTGSSEEWKDFYTTHARSKDLSAVDAVAMLRKAFCDNRLILIGVDELSKAGESSQNIMQQLGVVLNNDGRTDVLVSSLNPTYIRELLTGSQRNIEYVPITPLPSSALEKEFRSVSEAMVRRIKKELDIGGHLMRNRFNERILRNIHILASGHPRTAEHLKKAVESGAVDRKVKALLARHDAVVPYQLLRALLKLPQLSKFSEAPENDAERELILSVGAKDVTRDASARVMLDRARCFIFHQQDTTDTTDTNYRLTTTLSSFFNLLDHLFSTEANSLQPLSRAARELFQPREDTPFQIADLWERAHCLSVVSSASYLLWEDRTIGNKVFSLSSVCGLNSSAFGCAVRLGGELNVKVTMKNETMEWKRDTLYVAPAGQAGFDYSLCLLNREGEQMFGYVEINSGPSTNNTTTIATIFAHKLRMTLREHLERVNLTKSGQDDQLVALKHTYFVLSRFGSEVSNMTALKNEVEKLLQEEVEKELVGKNKKDKNKKAELDLTLAFVEHYWDRNVAFQGTTEMTASMVPAVLPIAQLVQAVGKEDEEDKSEEGEWCIV